MYILCVKWSLYIVLLMEYIFTFKIIAFAFYAFFQYLFSAMKNGKIEFSVYKMRFLAYE